MSKNIRIQQALENEEANIKYLATMSDKKLVERLEAIHLQQDIAMKTKNNSSYEILEVWRSQAIWARTYKAENKIPDKPSEIELAIADVETYTAEPEKPQDSVNESTPPFRKFREKIKQQNNDDQLSLF